MKTRRWFRWAGLCAAVLLGGVHAAGTARGQVVTVTAKSATDLRDQARALVNAVDPESARPLVDALDKLDDPDALKGLDRGKPLGAFADLPDGPGQLPSVVVFVPVTDAKAFLGSLEKLGVAVDDKPGAEGFSHRLTLPGGGAPPLYVLTSGGYVFASTTPGGADRLRNVKPAELRPGQTGAVVASVRVDRIPGPIKDGVLNQVEAANTVQKERQPGEAEAAHRARVSGIDLVQSGFTSLVRDTREVSFEVGVPPKDRRVVLTLALDAQPGTRTADGLKAFGACRSRFAGVDRGGAARLYGTLPVPDALRAVILEGVAQARAETGKEKDPEDRRMAAHLLDAVEPTLTGKELDAVVTVDGLDPAGKGGSSAVVLFGVGATGSDKIEATFREAVKKAKPEDRKKITLDLDHAGKTAIHRVTLDPDDLNDKRFGKPLMFVAFPEGAALGAVGEDGLALLKRAIASLTAPDSGSAPQVGVEMSAERSARFIQDPNQVALAAEAAREVFQGPNAGKDRLRLVLTTERSGLRLRLEGDLPVLRFFFLIGSRTKTAAPGR